MTEVFDSLGWALLHSLWQGGIAFLAVILFRGLFKNGSPSLRYNFQIFCLLACFAAFMVTFGLYQSGGQATSELKKISAAQTISQAASVVMGGANSLQVTPEALSLSAAASAPILGLLWCLGFAVMAARYLAAYVMTQQLRRSGLTEAPLFWQNRFRTLVLNTGLAAHVSLYVSRHVSGPLTIGFIKPVVLVPAGFLMGLPQDQVEAILLHELAHIRRYDYLVNLLQTAIKTVLFFHPAVHYISNKIDIDREQACDDLAVKQSRNPHALARGLAALRLETSGYGFAMAAEGGDSPLVARLKRLAGSVEYQRRPAHLLMPLLASVLMGGIYFSATSAASAHPEPKTYEHAKAEHENYQFETQKINGKTVTVKITEDGARWVLAGGAWIDIEKSPGVISILPVARPKPPQPPFVNDSKLDSGAFESEMNQYQIDLDYFEADLERYVKENHQLSDQELSRLKRDIERSVEKAEREAERMVARYENSIEQAERQRERKQEQRERVQEQLERAAEQRARAKEQTEHAAKMHAKADKQHAKYNDLRETLYDYLIQDGYLSSPSETASIRFENDNWTVNGTVISSVKEDKYCRLIAQMGIKKSTVTKIEVTSDSTHVVSKSSSAPSGRSHKITIGKHVHKDGTIHDPAKPAAPVPPAPPASDVSPVGRYPQPVPPSPVHPIKSDVSYAKPSFVWPAESSNVSAVYGQRGTLWERSHQGLDIKAEVGIPVLASADGIVERAANQSKWGNRITLKHTNGYQTLYGHMNSFYVSPGQSVKAGEVIGSIGSTGQSTGPHLHFEIRKDGQTLDPLPLIH